VVCNDGCAFLRVSGCSSGAHRRNLPAGDTPDSFFGMCIGTAQPRFRGVSIDSAVGFRPRWVATWIYRCYLSTAIGVSYCGDVPTESKIRNWNGI